MVVVEAEIENHSFKTFCQMMVNIVATEIVTRTTVTKTTSMRIPGNVSLEVDEEGEGLVEVCVLEKRGLSYIID